MPELVPYHPKINFLHVRAFDERLQSIPGSWTIIHSFLHDGDPRVIRLRWIITEEQWCSIEGFLTFLDQRCHRLLLRCFLQRESVTQAMRKLVRTSMLADTEVPLWDLDRTWTNEQLLQKMGKSIQPDQLQQVLHFLMLQELIMMYQEGEWSCGTGLARIENMGSTFEWVVQECLQRFHHAIARRCVSFKEWQTPPLNDLDVLAFTEDGLIIIVECKSSTDISLDHTLRFMKRAAAFPADIALLLIDTESMQTVVKQLQRMNTILDRGQVESGTIHQHKGSVIAHFIGNLYVANTAGGIAASLDGTLQLYAASNHPNT